MSEQEKCCSSKEESPSCHSKSCCRGGKLLAVVLVSFLLFGAGFMVGKSNLCAAKYCPLSQTQK